MDRLTLTQTPSARLQNTHQLVHMLKVANVMSMPEKKFSDLVHQVESDPLFKKFFNSPNPKFRLIGYKRFSKSFASTRFLELNENLTSSSGGGQENLDGYLNDKKEIVALCQKIGMDRFKEFFLYNDGTKSTADIAKQCEINESDVQKTLDMVNHVAVQEEFRNQPTLPLGLHHHYSKIAEFEKESEAFVVKYTSLRYARGRYNIDYEKLSSLKNDPEINGAELRQLKSLIKSMELINSRKSTLCQILEKIIERQKDYLDSKDISKLKSLTQLELARELDIHSSTVSRAIYGKSVSTPWSEEVPIKALLAKGPVNKIKATIQNIILDEERKIGEGSLSLPYRDDEIKNLLRTDHQMIIATRTVAKYRSELQIPNVYDRANSYKETKN